MTTFPAYTNLRVGYRVTIETAAVILGIVLVVAVALFIGWVIEFAPNPRIFRQFIAASVLAGFAILLCLFAIMVAIWRADTITGQEISELHHPLMWSLGAIAIYFGMASISAVDVFYKPDETWPLLRDPANQLITATVVIGTIVLSRAWFMDGVLRLRGWNQKTMLGLWALIGFATILMIALPIVLGRTT